MASDLSLQETVAANQRTFTARELRSGTDYLVTVIAQYPNSVGESASAKQRTRSLPGVSSLRLVQAGFFSLSVGWDVPSSAVQGYRLTYGPRVGTMPGMSAQLLEQSLAADSTSVTLESLQPDTEYVISLYPLFPRNSASPSVLNARIDPAFVLDTVHFCDAVSLWWELTNDCTYCLHVSRFMFLLVSVRLEAVQQLSVDTVSEGSVRVRWRGVSGARAYRLVWGPFTGQDKGHRLRTSFTSYHEGLVIGVAAVVGQRVGEVATLSARTNPHGGGLSGLRVVDVTSQRIRITWSPTARATGYRITWLETTRTVGADVSSYAIDGLQSNSAYSVQVSALSGSREGIPSTLTIRTGILLNHPVSIIVVVVRVTWVGVQGATSYRVSWKRTDGEVLWPAVLFGIILSHSSVDLDRLDPGAQYEVQVMALVQNREGTPVSVRVTTRESCLPALCRDTSPGLSVTLPSSSSSYQVTGLRLGRRYRFSVRPSFQSGMGRESFVDERTGNTHDTLFPVLPLPTDT
uniref:Fibronectin type-III domain-containing protein n=1 Tax=Stegastes partitus TaxID=144197 RepID=A0A3B5B8I6_9TELE